MIHYRKDIANEFIGRGWIFNYSHKEEGIHYDTYHLNHIEVTIDHTNEQVLFNIEIDNQDIKIEDELQLQKLLEILNQITN